MIASSNIVAKPLEQSAERPGHLLAAQTTRAAPADAFRECDCRRNTRFAVDRGPMVSTITSKSMDG
jgi:hypothetical protein